MVSQSWHSLAQPLLPWSKKLLKILEMHKFITVKATSNRPNSMYTVEKMETVPDEEVEKREQPMHHIFGEVISDLKNNG